MSELKATFRLGRVLKVAALVTFFYVYPPSGILSGIWRYVQFSLIGATLVLLWRYLKWLIYSEFAVIIFAAITRPLFRPWCRDKILIVPADQFLLVDNSLYYRGEPVFCEVNFGSWRYVLHCAGRLKVKHEKGMYCVFF